MLKPKYCPACKAECQETAESTRRSINGAENTWKEQVYKVYCRTCNQLYLISIVFDIVPIPKKPQEVKGGPYSGQ